MKQGILTLVILAGLFGCSSSASQKSASDSTTTTTEQVTSSTAAATALSARADLTTAIAQWNASCDLAQCARSTPDGLAQALADRARAFAPFASGYMVSRANELAAAAEKVVQLGGCVYSVERSCWLALQGVALARDRYQEAVAAQ